MPPLSRGVKGGQHAPLARQSLDDLHDITKISPIMSNIMSRQATLNIGTIGHVAHGKSTLVNAVSGVNTVKFKKELVNNITIKLGYANAKIYMCPQCESDDAYFSSASSAADMLTCPKCQTESPLVRHISFVDCPGHEILMATMLNGASIMDAALLLIAANDPCPQPQTREHLAAIEMTKLSSDRIVICQNKIDLVTQEQAKEQHNALREFVRGTMAEFSDVIPLSAQLKFNVDSLLKQICQIPLPVRDYGSALHMMIVRSFDVNKPGADLHGLKGGVIGGSIARGILRLGQSIEIRPGIVEKSEGSCKVTPIITTVKSIQAEGNSLMYAVPGGLIGIGTNIDPSLTKADKLVGQIVGDVGRLPPTFSEIDINVILLRTMMGMKLNTEKTKMRVTPIQNGETLLLNIGSMTIRGVVKTVIMEPVNRCCLSLNMPICGEIGSKIIISRKIDRNWRLIGRGIIHDGKELHKTF